MIICNCNLPKIFHAKSSNKLDDHLKKVKVYNSDNDTYHEISKENQLLNGDTDCRYFEDIVGFKIKKKISNILVRKCLRCVYHIKHFKS